MTAGLGVCEIRLLSVSSFPLSHCHPARPPPPPALSSSALPSIIHPLELELVRGAGNLGLTRSLPSQAARVAQRMGGRSQNGLQPSAPNSMCGLVAPSSD